MDREKLKTWLGFEDWQQRIQENWNAKPWITVHDEGRDMEKPEYGWLFSAAFPFNEENVEQVLSHTAPEFRIDDVLPTFHAESDGEITYLTHSTNIDAIPLRGAHIPQPSSY